MLKKKTIKASVLAAVIMLLALCTHLIDESAMGYGNSLFLSLIILQLLVLALPAVFFIKNSDRNYSEGLHLNLLDPTRFWLTVTALLTVIFGSSVIRLLMAYMGNTDSLFGDYSSIISSAIGEPAEVIYILITFAVIPALCEELVYRGIIYSEYKCCGFAAALIIPSVYSAMFRFSPSGLILFIFIGIICSLIVYLTDSLISAIVIHMMFNAFNIFFEKYILRIITQTEYATLCAFVLISLALFSFILMLSEAERLCHNDALEGRSLGDVFGKADDNPASDDNENEIDEDSDLSEKLHAWGNRMMAQLKLFGSAFLSPFFVICILIYIFGCIQK